MKSDLPDPRYWRKLDRHEKVIKGDHYFDCATGRMNPSQNWKSGGYQAHDFQLIYYRPISGLETEQGAPTDQREQELLVLRAALKSCRAACQARGITSNEFARMCGLSRYDLSLYTGEVPNTKPDFVD